MRAVITNENYNILSLMLLHNDSQELSNGQQRINKCVLALH